MTKNIRYVSATPVHSMPEASAIHIAVDCSGSSSIADLAVVVQLSGFRVHVSYKSNPEVHYLYVVDMANGLLPVAMMTGGESLGQAVNLIKKVAYSASKHIDGEPVVLLATSPMPIAEAVGA